MARMPSFAIAVHFRTGVGNRSGENAAKGNQAVRSGFAIFHAPVVHLWRESDDFRRDVVDQPRAFNAQAIEQFEKLFGSAE